MARPGPTKARWTHACGNILNARSGGGLWGRGATRPAVPGSRWGPRTGVAGAGRPPAPRGRARELAGAPIPQVRCPKLPRPLRGTADPLWAPEHQKSLPGGDSGVPLGVLPFCRVCVVCEAGIVYS